VGGHEAAWRDRRHLRRPCFKTLPNPFAETIYTGAQTLIYRLILFVIGIFALIYLGLGYVRLTLV
jgi:hypothetical protein